MYYSVHICAFDVTPQSKNGSIVREFVNPYFCLNGCVDVIVLFVLFYEEKQEMKYMHQSHLIFGI